MQCYPIINFDWLIYPARGSKKLSFCSYVVCFLMFSHLDFSFLILDCVFYISHFSFLIHWFFILILSNFLECFYNNFITFYRFNMFHWWSDVLLIVIYYDAVLYNHYTIFKIYIEIIIIATIIIFTIML